MSFEIHDVSRHFADEAAFRFHAGQPSPDPVRTEPAETPAADPLYTPSSRGYEYVRDYALRMLQESPTHPTIAHAIDVARHIGGWWSGGERVIPLSWQDRDHMAAELVHRYGPTYGGNYNNAVLLTDGYLYDYHKEKISPSARLNLLAAGQSLGQSPTALSVRRETAVTGIDLSGALDTRRPINPTDALKIQGVLAATHTDLEGLAAQGLAASARANAGFGDLVGRAVDALVTGTNNAMEALAAGALQRTFESKTRVERGAITDGRGRVIAPATEEHSRFREDENFPARTRLQAGGGTVQVIGVPVREAVFRAAAASLGGRADHRDPSGDPHVIVTDHSAEASCAGNGVAVASAASVDIGAPSATITFGPTTISRG